MRSFNIFRGPTKKKQEQPDFLDFSIHLPSEPLTSVPERGSRMVTDSSGREYVALKYQRRGQEFFSKMAEGILPVSHVRHAMLQDTDGTLKKAWVSWKVPDAEVRGQKEGELSADYLILEQIFKDSDKEPQWGRNARWQGGDTHIVFDLEFMPIFFMYPSMFKPDGSVRDDSFFAEHLAKEKADQKQDIFEGRGKEFDDISAATQVIVLQKLNQIRERFAGPEGVIHIRNVLASAAFKGESGVSMRDVVYFPAEFDSHDEEGLLRAFQGTLLGRIEEVGETLTKKIKG